MDATKIVDDAADTVKLVDNASDATKMIDNAADDAIEKIVDDIDIEYVVNSNTGEKIQVPDGANNVKLSDTEKGINITGGSGGGDFHPNTDGVRIMQPVEGGRYPYPDGYYCYMNETGQKINPYTGQTIPKSDPIGHIPLLGH